MTNKRTALCGRFRHCVYKLAMAVEIADSGQKTQHDSSVQTEYKYINIPCLVFMLGS